MRRRHNGIDEDRRALERLAAEGDAGAKIRLERLLERVGVPPQPGQIAYGIAQLGKDESVLFVTPDRRWLATIYASGSSGRVIDDKTGFCDSWIRYEDGRVAYDFPERIPAKIRKRVAMASRRKRHNSIDDEIRSLERKEREGPLTAAEARQLATLKGRSGGLVPKVLPYCELPDVDEFVAHATAWAENEIRQGLRKPSDPPLIYGIDLTAATGDTQIDDLIDTEGGFKTTSIEGATSERPITGVTTHRDYSGHQRRMALREKAQSEEGLTPEETTELAESNRRQNTQFMTFPTWEDVHEYLSRLCDIVNEELKFDDNLGGGQNIIVEEGVWYTGEAGGEGFSIPPGVTSLSPSGDQDTAFPELALEPPPVTTEDPTPQSETVRLEDEIAETENKLEEDPTPAARKTLEDRLDRLREIRANLEDYVFSSQRHGITEVTAYRGWGAALTGNDQYDWHAVLATQDEAIRELASFYEILLPDEIEELKERAGEMAGEILKAAGYEWDKEDES